MYAGSFQIMMVWPHLVVLPRGPGLPAAPASLLHALVGDDEVVPLAADPLDGQRVAVPLQLLLHTLEEARALPLPVEVPARRHGLDQQHDGVVCELRRARHRFAGASHAHQTGYTGDDILGASSTVGQRC